MFVFLKGQKQYFLGGRHKTSCHICWRLGGTPVSHFGANFPFWMQEISQYHAKTLLRKRIIWQTKQKEKWNWIIFFDTNTIESDCYFKKYLVSIYTIYMFLHILVYLFHSFRRHFWVPRVAKPQVHICSSCIFTKMCQHFLYGLNGSSPLSIHLSAFMFFLTWPINRHKIFPPWYLVSNVFGEFSFVLKKIPKTLRFFPKKFQFLCEI